MFRPALRVAARRSRIVQARFSTSGGHAHNHNGHGHYQYRVATVLGGTLAIATGLYLSTESIKLDSEKKRTKLIPYSEVQKHNTADDCWVVLDGKVYDLTKFLSVHPGGDAPIIRAAGHDATAIFAPLHSPGIIEDRLLPVVPDAYVGDVDPSTLPALPKIAVENDNERKIDLSEIVGLPDFDEAARRNMSSKAWSYISAGATDMTSVDLNRAAWNWVLFRPRVLVDVAEVDTSTTFLGQATSMPLFICPTGMSKLAGDEGEPGIAAAAGECGVIQMVSTNASAPLEAIVGGKSKEDQVQFMQLYVDKKRVNSEVLLDKVNKLGFKAVFVTADCPAPGKREADERNRAQVEVQSGISGGVVQRDKKGGGVGRTTGAFIDPKLSWDDIAWLRSQTTLPIGVKGIQCVEDAVRCAEMGVDAIYLSNHGGRALDTSPPALYTLLELRKTRPDVFEKCEVYVDGGVRRGADVVKALCLGARGVGMARPVLYGLTYGKEGVMHALDIMRDEIEVTMKLLGVNKLDELGPHLINTKVLDQRVIDGLEYGPKERYLPKK